MQSIVSIIVFLLLSILLGTITTRFISLAEEKNGKDFSIKEYIYSFKDFRLNLKYVIIFFILYLLVVKTILYFISSSSKNSKYKKYNYILTSTYSFNIRLCARP